MVAIITGKGTGLERSSAWVLGSRGQLGSATMGRDGEGVYVNAANGNLVITRQDEFLIGLGTDAAIDRTYNSQATSDGDNNDNWRVGANRKVAGLSGTYGAAGTTVTRTDWDGSETVYTWNATYADDGGTGAYVATDGDGAYDILRRSGSTWTWTDGDSRATELYDETKSGRITTARDADLNLVSYEYDDANGGRISRVKNQNGAGTGDDEYVDFVYTSGTLTQLLTTRTDGTHTRVRYAYETYNGSLTRLASVTVDLSPNDGAVADGNTYVTTYTYETNSNRVASITQKDGSSISFTYALVGGVYKIASYTQAVAAGVTRTTSFDYSVAGRTAVTDPAGQKTILWYNGNNELTQISYPPESANITPKTVQFQYEDDGDVKAAVLGPGNTVRYEYDEHGNLRAELDSAGNLIWRTYSNKNELRTESRVVDWSPSVPDFGFEMPAIGAAYQYNPTVSGVTFTGYSGVAGYGSGFGFVAPLEGSQVGFVQTTGTGGAAITQTITGLTAGKRYVVMFQMAGRPGYGGTPVTVSLNGGALKTVTPKSNAFEIVAIGFVATGSSNTISFSGTATAQDLATAIDNVRVGEAETDWYAYDAESHLRYVVTDEGRITQHEYNANGTRKATDSYPDSAYSLTGITPTTAIDESPITSFVSGLDKTTGQRTEYAYDNRGNRTLETAYSKLLSNGLSDTSSEKTETAYTYNIQGQMLTRQRFGSSAVEVFTYDGMGRIMTATDFAGSLTKTSYFDSLGQTVITYSTGLSDLSAYNKTGELITYSTSSSGANLVDLNGWPGNPANVPSGQATVAGWANYSAYTDETQWAATLGPDGLPVVAIQSGQLDASQEGGGNFTNEMPIDATKAYEFTWQFKLSAMDKHYVFFGLSGGTPAYVENLNDGVDNGNPYFWYAYPGMQDTYLDPDKWYKVVGYVLPQGTPTSSAPLGGVYDVATGEKVLDLYLNFRWNPERTGNTVHSRFFDYYGEANQQYSTYFYQPEVRQVSTASVLGPDAATSLFRYDNLGRLRMTADPTGRRSHMMYDSVGRKIADIDADGSVTEYRYDGNGNLTSTTRYANKLSSGQLASLIDGNGNPTSASLASLRPTATADDQWTFSNYDSAQRLVQTIDGTGATTVYTYDGASRLTATRSYANKLGATTLANLKTWANNPNYWSYGQDGMSWYKANLNVAAAGTIDGTAAYQFTVIASDVWQAVVSGGIDAVAGQTITTTMTVKGVGGVSMATFGLYGNASGWGPNGYAYATIVSGPGSITYQDGALFQVSGLSTTEATRFTITRTTRQAEGITPYFYLNTSAAVAGQSEILSAPVLSTSFTSPMLPTADPAKDRITRNFYDKDGLVVAKLDGAGGLTEFTYDKAGQKTKETARAKAADSSLWATGTLAQLQSSAGTTSADRRMDYVYDSRGFVRYTVDAAGHVVKFQNDAMGNLSRTVAYDGVITVASSYSVASVLALVTAGGLDTAAGKRVTRAVYDNAGRKAFDIDAMGSVSTYAYDSLGSVIKQTTYATLYSTFDDNPTLATMQSWAAGQAGNAANRVNRIVYDLRGRVAYTVDAENYVSENQYDRAGRVTKTIRYAGTYTVADGVTKESLAAQIGALPATAVVVSYAYDADGRVSDRTDGVGAVTHFTYDSFGQVIDTTIAYGTSLASTSRRGYDVLGRVLSETGAYGTGIASTTSYAYDALGNLISATDPLGYVTTRTYDSGGRVLTVSVPVDANPANDLVVTSEYDAFGNVVKSSRPMQAGTANTYRYYDNLGRIAVEIDAERYWTRTNYTAFGEIASIVRSYDKVASEPTTAALPTLPTHAQDATTSFGYDKMSRLLGVTDAMNFTETYSLDTFGQQLFVTNKTGGVTQFGHDKLGRLTYEYVFQNVHTTAGAVQSGTYYSLIRNYDSRGNVVWETRAGGVAEHRDTTFVYDKANRLIQAVHEQVQTLGTNLITLTNVSPTESYVYNLRGELVQSVDAGGGKTIAYYDALGRKTLEINPVGTLSGWTYNAASQVTAARVYETAVSIPSDPLAAPPTPTGAYRETIFGYDRAGRRLTATVSGLQFGVMSGSTFSTTYSGSTTVNTLFEKGGNIFLAIDGLGNTTWTWFDKLGRKIAQVDGENYLTLWDLDGNGNVKSETRYATRIAATITQSTAASALAGLAGTNAADRTTSFTYDKNGRRLTETRAGVLASTVSGTGALSTATQSATITYAYNGLGLVTSKTAANGEVTNYGYDGHGRLSWVKEPTITDYTGASVRRMTENFYDALGNLVRTEVNKEGGGAADDRVSTWLYGAGGRLTTATDAMGAQRNYYYDAAGRVLAEMYNRTKSDGTALTEGVAYRYDIGGRLIAQSIAAYNGSAWVHGDATRLRYNAFGEVTGRGITAGPDATAVYQETFDYDAGGRLWRSNTNDGSTRLFLYDLAGNRTLTLSSTGSDLTAVSQAGFPGWIGTSGESLLSNAVTTIAVYDKRGQQLATREPSRQLTASVTQTLISSRAYNAFGEVTAETDARNNTTNFTYNAMGRLTKKEAPSVSWTAENGAVSTARPTEDYYYDISGRLVAVTDANGNITTRALLAGTGMEGDDALVTAEFHADTGVARSFYDTFGDLRIRRNELYISGSTTDFDEVMGYDKLGRLTSVQHRGNLLTDTYGYDQLGQRIWHYNSQFGSSVKERTDYDLQGRVVSQLDFTGIGLTYTYAWVSGLTTNGLGTFGGWSKGTNNSGHVAYDETDYFGHLVTQNNSGSLLATISYDKGGRAVARSNGVGESIAYTYYNTGLISGQTGTQGIAAYEYDAAGNRTKETFSKGGVSYRNATTVYDAMGRMTSWSDTGLGGTTPASTAWEYDKAGNIRYVSSSYRELDTQGAVYAYASTKTYWYLYDSMNRFTLTKGELNGSRGSGTIERGAEGTLITYNKDGTRKSALYQGAIQSSRWAYMSGSGPYAYEIVNDGSGSGVWQLVADNFMGERREDYTYRADGQLMQTNKADAWIDPGAQPSPWDYSPPEPIYHAPSASGTLLATYSRDAMGRVTYNKEYGGIDGTYERTNITYDYAGRQLGETTNTARWESGSMKTYVTYITNTYSGGLLADVTQDTWKDNNDAAIDDSKQVYTYTWWDGPQQATIGNDKNWNGTTLSVDWTTTYTFDSSGRASSVSIADGRPRTVTIVTDQYGMVVDRDENDNQSGGDPRTLRYIYGGTTMGEVSNNGTSNMNYVAAIAERQQANWSNTGGFRGGSSYGSSSADFDQSFDSINGNTQAGSGSAYTVNGGDTLQSIAMAVWGDGSLWYLLAETNGLSLATPLFAGQQILIPNKQVNSHNNSSTFRPYDPNEAIGDNSPNAVNPNNSATAGKKGKKCGIVGQILMVAIAVAVSALTYGALTGPATGLLGSIAAGAVAGAAGSVASQAFGVATGIQSKFDWKGVGMAAITGAIGGGLGKLSALAEAGKLGSKFATQVGSALGGSGFVAGAARGLLSSALSQGIGVATGLQKKFDWVGVAAAGIGGGVNNVVGRALGATSLQGDRSFANVAANLGVSAATAMANAATRSLATGTSFGDNIMAALPDVIGSTLGNLFVAGLQSNGSRDDHRGVGAPITDEDMRNALPMDASAQSGLSGDSGFDLFTGTSVGPGILIEDTFGIAATGPAAPTAPPTPAAPTTQVDAIIALAPASKQADLRLLFSQSPTLSRDFNNILTRRDNPYRVFVINDRMDSAAQADESNRRIYITQGLLNGNPETFIKALSHEIGHVIHTGQPDRSSRDAHRDSRRREEGGAVLYSIRIEREIASNNGGHRIGLYVNQANVDFYERIYDRYLIDNDYETATLDIGRKFGNTEVSSFTNQPYKDKWDQEWRNIETERRREERAIRQRQRAAARATTTAPPH